MKGLEPADELQIDILNRVFGMRLEKPSLNLNVTSSDTQNPSGFQEIPQTSQSEVLAQISKDKHSFQNSKNQEILKNFDYEGVSSGVSVTSSDSSYYVTDIDGQEKQTFITSETNETLSSVVITKPAKNQPSDQRPSIDYKKLFPSDPLYATSSLASTSLPTLSSSQTSLSSSISSTSSVEGVGNLRFFN